MDIRGSPALLLLSELTITKALIIISHILVQTAVIEAVTSAPYYTCPRHSRFVKNGRGQPGDGRAIGISWAGCLTNSFKAVVPCSGVLYGSVNAYRLGRGGMRMFEEHELLKTTRYKVLSSHGAWTHTADRGKKLTECLIATRYSACGSPYITVHNASSRNFLVKTSINDEQPFYNTTSPTRKALP